MTSAGLTWRQLDWTQPLEPVAVAALLRNWAADSRSPYVVLETRWRRGQVEHLLGSHPAQLAAVLGPLRAFANVAIYQPKNERPSVHLSGRLRSSNRHRPLRLNDPEAAVRALFAAGLQLHGDESLAVQLILGPRRVPLAVPNASPASLTQPWWSTVWSGNGGQIDGERRTALRTKLGDHGFACTLRLGVRAANHSRQRTLLLSLLAAVRVNQAPGVVLHLAPDNPRKFNTAAIPWFWPLRLGVAELTSLTAWPLGEAALPGQGSLYPRRVPPVPAVTGKDRVLATAILGGQPTRLCLPAKNAAHHLHVVGPTGTGKSTLLANLILQDIAAGRSVVVIEPKGDLVDDVLERLPAGRLDDVVVLDPADQAPVGLNPLHAPGQRPELVADTLLTTLKHLYGGSIGPRSSDILYAGLLTLAQRGDASLVMLPLLLTNSGLRRSLTKHVRDPLVLGPFWAGFERWSEAERAAAVAPVLNKLRPLIRPGLRGVLGQRQPRFDLQDVFRRPTVLLAPLRRGLIGADGSDLLGSVLVAQLWAAIQAQSGVPRSQRRPVMVTIDEAQNYLHIADLAEALATSRGYNVSFSIAHQYLTQFPREMRAAVLANARSRVVFQTVDDDARILERGHSEVSAADLTALGSYELYASLHADNQAQPYAFGKSQPLPSAIRPASTVIARSRARYGQQLDSIEAGFASLLDLGHDDMGNTGRRPRGRS